MTGLTTPKAKALAKYVSRPVDGGGELGSHASPRGNPKGLPDGIVKKTIMIQNNMVMAGLTISMYFQHFEDLKF